VLELFSNSHDRAQWRRYGARILLRVLKASATSFAHANAARAIGREQPPAPYAVGFFVEGLSSDCIGESVRAQILSTCGAQVAAFSTAIAAMNLATWSSPLPLPLTKPWCTLLQAFDFSLALSLEPVCVAVVWIGYAADVQVGNDVIDNSFSSLSWQRT
jgi:threonine/homoserine efflux transporter RhtA